ncbi:hypothetical protein P8452_60596 [Trifolium repens]|nr:hypothetical protein P8452_60596 [Trifolium repens]
MTLTHFLIQSLLFISGREFSYGVKYDLNSRAEFLWFHGLISNSAFKSQVKMTMSPYEEARRIKIEENTKRMEALNLPSLSLNPFTNPLLPLQNPHRGDSNIAKVTLSRTSYSFLQRIGAIVDTCLSAISSSPTMLFCFGTSTPLNFSQELGTFGFIKSTKFGHAKILLVPVIVSL